MPTSGQLKTPLHAWHCDHGGKIVPFGGWEMPVQYEKGILTEHLATRRSGGFFDISHNSAKTPPPCYFFERNKSMK